MEHEIEQVEAKDAKRTAFLRQQRLNHFLGVDNSKTLTQYKNPADKVKK